MSSVGVKNLQKKNVRDTCYSFIGFTNSVGERNWNDLKPLCKIKLELNKQLQKRKSKELINHSLILDNKKRLNLHWL